MSAEYILTINDLQSYCDQKSEYLKNINGTCQGCILKRECLSDNRIMQINSVLQMNPSESRFPLLIKYAEKTDGGLLYSVPSQIYKMLYGTYHDSFGCPFRAALIVDNLEKIKQVYHLLSSYCSKASYLNVIMFRLTLQREYILRACNSVEPQYFIHPFRNLEAREIFVDCGAYDGTTYRDYCKYNDKPRKAYLFEPDEINMRKIMLEETDCNVQIIPKAVYRSQKTMYLVWGRKMGSYLSAEKLHNSIPIEVTSIDECIHEDVSFIKMDIEGSEMEALKGAKHHIQISYPKLAICLYHEIEHLWTIPLWLNSQFPEYTHYEIRHHSNNATDTVLYVYR